MYYLQSRYYDPWIGRFINADATWVLGVNQGSLLQFNLFTYCLNNPVNMIDPTGYVGFSTSGVTDWDELNRLALQTGGSGNTTGWQGSPQQRTATQQVVQNRQRAANNQNLSSQQRINAQAEVYVLQITILNIPMTLNWENPAQNLAAQRLSSTSFNPAHLFIPTNALCFVGSAHTRGMDYAFFAGAAYMLHTYGLGGFAWKVFGVTCAVAYAGGWIRESVDRVRGTPRCGCC